MKTWIKQQLTEITAWSGFLLIVSALIAPRWFILLLGILLICWDDKAASAFVAKRAPWLARKVDEWADSDETAADVMQENGQP